MNFGINAISLSKGGGRQIALGYLNYLSTLTADSNYFISIPLIEEFKYLVKNNDNFKIVNKKYPLNIFSRIKFENGIFKYTLNQNNIKSLITLGNLSCLNTSFRHIVLVHQAHLVYPENEVFPILSYIEKNRKKIEILYFKKMLQSTDILITQTEIMKDRLIHRYKNEVRTKKILVLPNTLFPLENYKENNNLNQSILSCPLWFVPTQYYPHKNLELLIDIARIFKSKKINIKFLITVTNNDHQRAINFLKLIKKRELSEFFINKGRINALEMPKIINNVTGMLFPSLIESQCFGMMEAMALKQPMICSDTDFSKYLCKKSAIYANPKNYDEWAEKIIILSNSTEKRRELSEEGFSRFNSINSIAKDTYKSYWEIQSQ